MAHAKFTFKPIISAPSEADNTAYFVYMSYGAKKNSVCVGIIAKDLCGWVLYDTGGKQKTGSFSKRQDLFNFITGKNYGI